MLFLNNETQTLDDVVIAVVGDWFNGFSLGTASFRSCVVLCELSASGQSRVDIWEALFDMFSYLIDRNPPSGTTRSIRGNSASRFSESTLRDDMDTRICSELHELVYPNTPGFLESYFLDQAWSAAVDRALKRSPTFALPSPTSPLSWKTWPATADQESVLQWFSEVVHDLVEHTSRRYCYSPTKPLQTPQDRSKRKPDVFLLPADEVPSTVNVGVSLGKALETNTAKSPFSWSQVLVVGELKKSVKDTLSPSLVAQLADYVRLIFKAQCTRRFVHAFTLCGDLMRCWIFHRGGGFSSDEFSINEQPELFGSVVVGYASMNPVELGYDPTLVSDSEGLHVTIPCSFGDGPRQRFILETPPFFGCSSIASRGTTCWKAKRERMDSFPYVCKDSWRPEDYSSEGSLLAEAQVNGVHGVVEYIGHEDLCVGDLGLDDIAHNIMKGLQVGSPLNLRPSDSRTTNSNVSSFRSRRSQGPRPSSTRKRTTSDEQGTSNKRSKTDSSSISKSFNRIHSRLIMSRGLPIYQFESNIQFLRAFHDAIAGHLSLLRSGILHRDISINNIMITLGNRSDGYEGFLIDLDLAIKVGATHPSAARRRAGTMEFMAIGTLLGHEHTYRHDLESFFYVFLWICVHYDGPHGSQPQRRPDIFDDWAASTYKAAARTKTGDMDPQAIEEILSRFTPRAQCLAGLARKMRDELFPFRKGLFIATEENFEPLYASLLSHIKDTIQEF